MKKINREYFLMLLIVLIIDGKLIVAKGPNSTENNTSKKWSYSPAEWCNKNVPVDNWLSTKQISSILFLQSQYDEIILPEIAKLEVLRAGINKVGNEPANNKQKEIQSLVEKLFELRLEARIKIRNVLSAKQILYFDDFIFSDWWNYKS